MLSEIPSCIYNLRYVENFRFISSPHSYSKDCNSNKIKRSSGVSILNPTIDDVCSVEDVLLTVNRHFLSDPNIIYTDQNFDRWEQAEADHSFYF